MRKPTVFAILISLASGALLVTCTQRYGSVAQESVAETLTSDVIAVTPCIPGFLLEPEQIHPLSPGEARLCEDWNFREDGEFPAEGGELRLLTVRSTGSICIP